jgi:hypothetical protein
MRGGRLVLMLAIAFTGASCTPSSITRDVARAAPPAVVNSTLRSLGESDNQRMVLELLRSPEMREATRLLTSQIADGALDSLSEPERAARVEGMLNEYIASLTGSISRSLALGMRRDLGPAVAVMVREAVGATLREVMRDGYQRDLERVAAGLTRATMAAAAQGVSEGMRQSLGPSLHGALRDPEVAGDVGLFARTIAREAVLGSNEAMAQIQRQAERGGRTTLLGRLTQVERIITIGGVAAIALSVALALWVVRLIMRSRRIQAESESNAASALMFAEAIRAAEGRPWAGELTEMLQRRLGGDEMKKILDRVLKPPEGPPPAHRDGRLSWSH